MYGAEAVILNMSRVLNSGPHHSILGVFSNSSNPNLQLHDKASEEGIESHVILCNGQLDRRAVAGIRELAVQTGADVVHAHGFKADVHVYLALRGSGIPFVSTCHTWYDNNWLVYFYGVVDRITLRKFARVVAVSDEVKNRLLKAGVQAGAIRLIRNGIDVRPFDDAVPSLRQDPALNDRLVVGLIGRLSWEKGVDTFLRSVSRVLVEYPSARFVVVGEGADKDKLEQLLDELKIRESVSMLGRRNDMPAVYASLDVMVSASRQEGLPMAILEGMASSLPLVATAVGEVPTIVLDRRTGILVRAENPDVVAEGILELLRDPAMRKRFGAAARKRVEEEYSAVRMTNDYLGVYAEAIDAVKKGKERRIESSVASQGNAE
jgi:glycosyltransferase involved in cell wall biosynthesis